MNDAAAWHATAWAAAEALGPTWVAPLRAFGGPPTAAPIALARARQAADDHVPALGAQIGRRLGEEVDADQASLFARRIQQVHAYLQRLGADDPTFTTLRIGLVARTAQALDATHPRAHRVRAIADYFYSQGARAAAARDPRFRSASTAAASITASPSSEIAPGLDFGTFEGPTREGPFRASWIVVAPGAGHLDAVAFGPDGPPSGPDVLAVTSGGFFLYSEPDIRLPEARRDPVGWLTSGGVVQSPPVFPRAALVVDHDGTISITARDLHGFTLVLSEGSFVVDRARVVHRAHGRVARGPGVAVAAGRVVGVGVDLPVPTGGFVWTCPDGPPGVAVGGSARFESDAPVRAAMAGGPRLIEGGRVVVDSERMRAEAFVGDAPPVTFSQDETFDQNLLPRCAAGVRPDGSLVVLAVDGRHPDRALGTTLRGLSELMQSLGAREALNLDGGSSKRLIVDGIVRDLPNTDVVTAATSTGAATRAMVTGLVLSRWPPTSNHARGRT